MEGEQRSDWLVGNKNAGLSLLQFPTGSYSSCILTIILELFITPCACTRDKVIGRVVVVVVVSIKSSHIET